MRVHGSLIAALLVLGLASGPALAQEINLLALGNGALPVVETPSYGGEWTPAGVLDDAPGSGWASPP